MAASPRISIVIVNFQSAWSLSWALKSLFALESDGDLFEVIVLNNDITERRVLESLSQSLPFRLVQSVENIGFGQGANEAVMYAQGTLLGFLNPDTRWLQASLKDIVTFFDRQQQETILGLTLIDEHGMTERWSKGVAPTLALLIRGKVADFFGLAVGEKRALDWVSGGGVFLAQDTFRVLDGFSPDFFLYFEDVDLCVRAKKQGVTIVSDPGFLLEHHGGKSFRSRAAQKAKYYAAQLVYFQKHRPRREFLIMRLIHQLFKSV